MKSSLALVIIFQGCCLLAAASTYTEGANVAPTSPFNPSGDSHLTNYDQFISSSMLGEPVFRLEPPNVINFANTRGATLLCLASGSPRPTISWYSSPAGYDISQQSSLSGPSGDLGALEESKLVENVTNLRVILQDGSAIRLLPFKSADFRPDIHAAEYRCVASNPIATIHSRSASVQAGKWRLSFLVFSSFCTVSSIECDWRQ